MKKKAFYNTDHENDWDNNMKKRRHNDQNENAAKYKRKW